MDDSDVVKKETGWRLEIRKGRRTLYFEFDPGIVQPEKGGGSPYRDPSGKTEYKGGGEKEQRKKRGSKPDL